MMKNNKYDVKNKFLGSNKAGDINTIKKNYAENIKNHKEKINKNTHYICHIGTIIVKLRLRGIDTKTLRNDNSIYRFKVNLC